MIRWKYLFIIGLMLISQVTYGQFRKKKKDWGFCGYFSLGVNIPSEYSNNSGKLNFLNSTSNVASNPGIELIGVAYYKQIGFNLGVAYYKYIFDKEELALLQQNNHPDADVTVFMSNDIKHTPVFAGFSYYFKISNIYFEPKVLVKYSKAIAPRNVDVYFWDNKVLSRSITYNKLPTSRLELLPGISLSFFYSLTKEHRVGIQFSYSYALSKPEYEYRKQEADMKTSSIKKEVEKITTTNSTSNFGFGLILRFN